MENQPHIPPPEQFFPQHDVCFFLLPGQFRLAKDQPLEARQFSGGRLDVDGFANPGPGQREELQPGQMQWGKAEMGGNLLKEFPKEFGVDPPPNGISVQSQMMERSECAQLAKLALWNLVVLQVQLAHQAGQRQQRGQADSEV
jgi:hypothetical protein